MPSDSTPGIRVRNEEQHRHDLCLVGRWMYERGYIVAGEGNLSVRLDANRILTTPTCINKGMMTPGDLVVMDTYAMHARQATTAVVTGKPIELGGSRGRREATGRGVMMCVNKAIEKLGLRKETTRVVVQGFGNVGSLAAELMQKAGYKIIGLADIGGGLYNENGFHVPEVIKWVYTQKKPLQEFPGGGTKMSARDVLFQPCEVVIPAAIENQITAQNAHQVQARILCEGANGPTTWQADAIIDAKGIFTVPDILGNAGGVTVSYFEWVQDRQGFFWRESEVNERLLDVMERAFDEVVRYAELHRVNNRIAAYMLAIDRVARALKLRGIYA